jgi:SAM-dependent methyltransferase/FKBP-type peptidyl-prolyl cis-trans isomerase 2
MQTIQADTTADLFFQINWDSSGVRHTDAYAGLQVNFWRDIVPGRLCAELQGKRPGDAVRLGLPSSELLDAAAKQDLKTIDRRQFDARRFHNTNMEPRTGRFYPKGLLKDMAGIFAANVAPFRCVQVDNGHLAIDLGHPLSEKQIDLNVTVGTVRSKSEERGGTLRSWGELITQGVGMQARWQDRPTDFFSDAPFERLDGSADAVFYTKPRLVQHIDDTALDMVRQIQARFVQTDMSVLDLMGSWQTHLPENTGLKKLTGLGLNAIELQHNKMLNASRVHDLNADPELPFGNRTFDAVLCSLSVEYLIHPLEVFSEVARVLKPGGTFVVTFSNRWFEPKTIRLWTELHEFERMGLVLEYFRNTHRFEDLHTYSVRGLARPVNDKYYGQLPYSDPVYTVWGQRI